MTAATLAAEASGESNSDSTSRYTVETVGSVLSLVASSLRRASDSSVLSANACVTLDRSTSGSHGLLKY